MNPEQTSETTVNHHPRRVRVAFRVTSVIGLSVAMGASSVSGVWSVVPTPHPVRSSLHHVVLTAVAQTPASRHTAPAPGRLATVASTSEVELASAVAVVGVTWAAGTAAGDRPQVRVQSRGAWGAWSDLDADADHAPDADRPEGARVTKAGREGTAPLVVTGAKRVQVRILSSSGTAPRGARLEVIDPGSSAADAAAGPRPGAASAAAAKPTILSRAAWGADESKRVGTPSYGTLQLGFVHHTAGSNSYTADQVPAIIRGIYAYHVDGQGWNDIGYNFLVDRFGRTWEGRYGGMDRPVVGAQTANLNSWSTGVSVLGNFESTTPPASATRAVSAVLAWKFTLAGIPATGWVVVGGTSLNRISGHRDGVSTSCPGARLYAALPGIRSTAVSLVGTQTPTAIARDVDRNATPDLVTYPDERATDGTIGPLRLLKASSVSPVKAWTRIGTGWNGLTMMTTTPDISGDGKPDIIGVDPATGRLRVYRGNGTGGLLSTRSTTGSWWNLFRELVPVGDRTGDGLADLLGVTKTGELRLYAGHGNGQFGSSILLASNWRDLRNVLSIGDVTGDGRADLLATNGVTGEQRMFAGTAGGGVSLSVLWARSFGGYTAVEGGSDLDSDGYPDMLVREAGGRMRTYYGGPQGKWQRWNHWGSGWQGIDHVSAGVDFNGDGHPDVVGVNPAADRGALLLYAGTGARDFAPATALPAVPGADLAKVVGDVDGDGYTDLMVRVPARRSVELLRGQAKGVFLPPVSMGTGWNEFTMIEPMGDLTRDGVPDLAARTASGEVWIYPMTRTLRFKARYLAATGWGSMLSLTGAGALNGDANGDVVGLTADHSLVFYRGGGNGAVLRDSVVLKTGQDDLVQIVGVNDYNGDGRRDIMARAVSGRLWLYAGTGTGAVETTRQSVHWDQGAGHGIA